MKTGSALIEFSIGMTVFSISVGLFLFAVNACVLKWNVLEVAQLGTDLQAMTRLSTGEIELLLRKNQHRKNISGRAEWLFDFRPPITPSARFYDLVQTKVSAKLPGHLTLEESVVSQKEPYE